MNIVDVDMYLDGGTMIIKTDKYTYYFDGEIRSQTPGRLYGGNSTMMNEEEIKILEEKIFEALTEWKDEYSDGKCVVEIIKELKQRKPWKS